MVSKDQYVAPSKEETHLYDFHHPSSKMIFQSHIEGLYESGEKLGAASSYGRSCPLS